MYAKKKEKQMDIRQQSERYALMAKELIDKLDCFAHIRDSQVSIGYLSSEHKLKKNGGIVYGQCEKIQSKYQWAIPYDFTITIFEPNVEELTEEQLRTVMKHELMHVGVTTNDDGEEVYKIVPHDLEDFKAIVKEHGVDWSV